MSLLMRLILRIAAVALLCLSCAVAWVVADTDAMVRTETAKSAQRVAYQLERLYMLGSAGWGYSASAPTRSYIAMLGVMSPGICVEFDQPDNARRRLCSGWNTLGTTAPDWFREAFGVVFDPGAPAEAEVRIVDQPVRIVVATHDPVAAATRAWHQFRIVAGMAAAMAAGMALLAAMAVWHALMPAQTIMQGLRRLEQGDLSSRLPDFPTAEFSRIARAFNDLASRLERTGAERTALTRRLFQVQEDERRALARDLHDEFGQCLTATSALAASIAAGAPPDRPDLGDDARAISRVTTQMMTTLKGALMRLRPPDFDELGLEASLRRMVAAWNAQAGARTRFRLEVEGDLAAVSSQEALNVYRIAQECLTNAARHGRPSEVTVRVSRAGVEDGAVVLVVDDDGGGDPDQVAGAPGLGILGIRERIGALGGTLSIGRSAGGVRVSAAIPTLAEARAS